MAEEGEEESEESPDPDSIQMIHTEALQSTMKCNLPKCQKVPTQQPIEESNLLINNQS